MTFTALFTTASEAASFLQESVAKPMVGFIGKNLVGSIIAVDGNKQMAVSIGIEAIAAWALPRIAADAPPGTTATTALIDKVSRWADRQCIPMRSRRQIISALTVIRNSPQTWDEYVQAVENLKAAAFGIHTHAADKLLDWVSDLPIPDELKDSTTAALEHIRDAQTSDEYFSALKELQRAISNVESDIVEKTQRTIESYASDTLSLMKEEPLPGESATNTLLGKVETWTRALPISPESKRQIIAALQQIRNATTLIDYLKGFNSLKGYLASILQVDEEKLTAQKKRLHTKMLQLAMNRFICDGEIDCDPEAFVQSVREEIDKAPTHWAKKCVQKFALLPFVDAIASQALTTFFSISRDYLDILTSNQAAQVAFVRFMDDALTCHRRAPNAPGIRRKITYLGVQVGFDRLIPQNFLTQHVNRVQVHFVDLCSRGGMGIRLVKWVVLSPAHVALACIYTFTRVVESVARPVIRLIALSLVPLIEKRISLSQNPLVNTILLYQLSFMQTLFDANRLESYSSVSNQQLKREFRDLISASLNVVISQEETVFGFLRAEGTIALLKGFTAFLQNTLSAEQCAQVGEVVLLTCAAAHTSS